MDNSQPKITVIIPSLNAKDYISECVESVINQTLKDIEIICIDAGSTDGTFEILKKFANKDPRVKIGQSSKRSYGYQMNLALKLANGEYIGIVESDDYISKNMYEDLYNLSKNGTVDIVKGTFYHVYDYNDELKKDWAKKELENVTEEFTIFEHERFLDGHPSIWAGIYKRELIEKNNIEFTEEPGGGWVDNGFFYETACVAKSIIYRPVPYYYYREVNPNSSSNNLGDFTIPFRRMIENLEILNKYNIKNENVLHMAYLRVFAYIYNIQRRDNYKDHLSELIPLLRKMLGMLDEKIVLKKLDKKMQNEYYEYLSLDKPKESKNSLNILFIPSDNNRTSGAFLSMANLVNNLKNKYNINEHVILPNKGNGDGILSSFGIDFQLIESRDWVIPLSTKKDDKFKKEVAEKIEINNKAITEIEKVIESKNIDLLHINTTYSYVGAKAALNKNIPFVWHLREFLEEDQSNTLWDREKGNQLINKANNIIAISDSIFKKYSSIFDDGKLVRIYNGIDADIFYKPKKEILMDDIIKFIMVGGFEYYKGQIEFAKACAKLYSLGYHNFEVTFVGTGKGEVKEKVENILNSVGMTNVKYEGYKRNVEDYYELADISFTCAKSEAFGRTTVEAMLSGNLVIGADSAGTKELIKNYQTGLLYKQGDSDDLCDKMIYAIENKSIMKNIANEGRDYMFQNMTAEVNADKIYSLYKEILKK